MGSLCLLLAAVSLRLLAADETPQIGTPSTAAPREQDARAHVHEIVIDLGPTRARDVRVVVELSGARRPARIARRFAAGAMSIAVGLVGGRAAGVIPPLADSMAQNFTGPGDTVFAVRGRSLRPLGGGLFVLRFQCVHDPHPAAGEGRGASVRVTVRPRNAEGGEGMAGAWQSLEAPSSALSSNQLP